MGFNGLNRVLGSALCTSASKFDRNRRRYTYIMADDLVINTWNKFGFIGEICLINGDQFRTRLKLCMGPIG